MKDYYKINEISKLYGIGVDSLRYYEKIGVLQPRRDTNGYRLYSLKDIYKLNVIRDLRQLDFSMELIKEYLDDQSIGHTLKILQEEQELIQAQLQELRVKKQIIRDRIGALKASLKVQTGIFSIKTLPERRCVQIREHITRDEEVDLVSKALHRKHESKIRDFGNQSLGALVSMEDLRKGLPNVFRSVFFVLEQEAKGYDFILPAGDYISYFYRGDYQQSTERVQEVLAYAQNQGWRTLGDPFEIYEVDNRDTMRADEFLTEIQVRISQT